LRSSPLTRACADASDFSILIMMTHALGASGGANMKEAGTGLVRSQLSLLCGKVVDEADVHPQILKCARVAMDKAAAKLAKGKSKIDLTREGEDGADDGGEATEASQQASGWMAHGSGNDLLSSWVSWWFW